MNLALFPSGLIRSNAIAKIGLVILSTFQMGVHLHARHDHRIAIGSNSNNYSINSEVNNIMYVLTFIPRIQFGI
jgi:hypothetical protein